MVKSLGLSTIRFNNHSRKRRARPVDRELLFVRIVWLGLFGAFIFLGVSGRLDNTRRALVQKHHVESLDRSQVEHDYGKN